MKVLLVGAGGQGAPCASILAADPDVTAVILGDIDLDLANEGDFLLISQFQDIPPDEARPLKRKFELDESACDVMFELLARWYVSPHFASRAEGFLNAAEIARAIGLFRDLRSAELQR